MSERRRKGQSVLMVDHANREGAVRGGSRSVDGMDLVMALRRPRDWCPRDGARFEVHVEEICGGRAFDPIVAQLCTDAQRPHWQWQSLRGPAIDRAVALLRQGLGAEAMGKAMGSRAPRLPAAAPGPAARLGRRSQSGSMNDERD
jgi:putative DNA primase/helicase